MPPLRARGTLAGMDSQADLSRRLENLIRIGTVSAVQKKPALCRVSTGGLETEWLPWFALRAGEDREWDPPSNGEQCIVICPSGDPAVGFVLCGVYSDRYPANDDSLDRHRRTYRDGAVIEYDTATHALRAELPAGGTAELIADGGIHFVGPITHEGDYTQTGNYNQTGSQTVSGTVTAAKDVIAAGISLANHPHDGVMPGPGLTGKPQP